MNVDVFKTSINSKELVITLEKIFDSNPSIINWSVDIEDIDNVLVVKSNDIKEQDIIEMVKSEGYVCEVLPD